MDSIRVQVKKKMNKTKQYENNDNCMFWKNGIIWIYDYNYKTFEKKINQAVIKCVLLRVGKKCLYMLDAYRLLCAKKQVRSTHMWERAQQTRNKDGTTRNKDAREPRDLVPNMRTSTPDSQCGKKIKREARERNPRISICFFCFILAM